ncbi:hypothetical protein ACI7BZ_16100 [Xanthobacter sp. AM11]|uniref:hypothetical protein n=1 Tax=Xanthobacter sp. AM11 TaxID=3380643 RepID=UPI0039BF562C
MARPIYIHVGTHKTATTSVQGLMARASKEIPRHGVFIPKAGRNSKDLCGHHNIGWSLRGDPRAQEKWGTLDDLCAELARARHPRALLSSEDFEYLVEYPDLLRRMEQKLEAVGWSPIYILFLRDPADYTISLYNELAKDGLKEDFRAFVDTILSEGRFVFRNDWTYYLDYNAFIARWTAAARGPLAVYSYDDAASGAGVLPAFLQSIGVPATQDILEAPPPRPHLEQRIRYFLRGRPLPSAPADPSRLNVNAARVTDDMRTEARRVRAAFALPRALMLPIGAPAIPAAQA